MAQNAQNHPLPAPPRQSPEQLQPFPPYPQQYPQQGQFQQQPQSQSQLQQQQYPLQQPQAYDQVQQQQQYQKPPLPPTPPQHQRPQPGYHPPQRQRPKSRAFSFRSDKSQKSAGSNKAGSNKLDLTETSAEKEAKRLHSKADPTLAMNEAEPTAVASYVKSSLASIRAVQHKDAFGNTISDPDKSNPTRNRWERPLDTIRSFEAAIDGGYSRHSIIQADTDSVANWNRRSSYYGNNGPRFPQESYYGGRPTSLRPGSSAIDLRVNGPPRDSFHENGPPQGPNGPYSSSYNAYSSNNLNPGRQRYSRMSSEPQINSQMRQQDQGAYPVPGNPRTYEAVASGSGSGSSGEPAGYQTDPTSSDNSSIERMQSPPTKPVNPPNDYGISFSSVPNYQPPGSSLGVKSQMTGAIPPSKLGTNGYPPNGNGGYYPQQQQHHQHMGGGAPPNPPPHGNNMGGGNYGSAAPPPLPRKDGSILRKPPSNVRVSVQQQQQQQQPQAQARPAAPEQRKSWFTRRFSKAS